MAGKRLESRRRTDAEIMRVARSQLATVGAAGLSLREIARDLGMVSSAIYRYVDSRDALLTRLIVEAYDSLGVRVETASERSRNRDDLDRWEAACVAVRAWAIDNAHEYLLLYGTPVPGYAAPSDTVGPGTRPTLALAAIVVDSSLAGRLEPCDAHLTLSRRISGELDRLAGVAQLALDAEHTAAFLIAWTQLFGLVGFELTNQTRGIVDTHEAFLRLAVRSTGYAIGLR